LASPPDPEPKAGHVASEIKAFGINHADMHMRRSEWAEAAKVIGIECVGLMKSCGGLPFEDEAPRPSCDRLRRRLVWTAHAL